MRPTHYFYDDGQKCNCYPVKYWESRTGVEYVTVRTFDGEEDTSIPKSDLHLIEYKPQREVFEAVEARGYTFGWTREQFAARQAVKLVEELGELHENFILPGETEYCKSETARRDFDDWPLWERCGILNGVDFRNYSVGKEEINKSIEKELADLQVVLFCLAESLGVDVIQAALDKSASDVARGVRGAE